MVSLRILGRLRVRLRGRSPQKGGESSRGAEHAFSIATIRKRILSYQDGVARRSWNAEDGNLAAELGHFSLMEDSKAIFRYSHEAMDGAAKRGLINVLQFLWYQGQLCTTEAVDGAAKAGHIDVLIWLHQHTCVVGTKAAMDWAARNGHLSVLKWMHINRDEGCTVCAMNWAAEEGHLHVVKWLHYNRQEGCTTAAFDRASMNNHVHVLSWLMTHRSEGGTSRALRWAISNGHTQIVSMLSAPRVVENSTVPLHMANSPASKLGEKAGFSRGGETPSSTTSSFSSVEVDSTNSTSFSSSYNSSVSRGSLLPVENGRSELTPKSLMCGCSKFAMNKAAQGGHLSTLVLLHRQGYSCTVKAMDWAAAFGQLDVVEWLSENRREGCTTDAMDHAAANGHLSVVIWLHENRKEGCTRYALAEAAANGHLKMVIWLHRHRDEGGGRRAMDGAAANGHLAVVHWLHVNRREGCSHEAMEKAAKNGHLRVAHLLLDLGKPCTAAAIRLAKVHGHLEVFELLSRAYPERAFFSDAATDELVQQEKEMIHEDKLREFHVQQEAQRRRLSVISGTGRKSGPRFHRSRRRRSKQTSSFGLGPIVFGPNGKPCLPPIDTSLQADTDAHETQ